jgi:hypothetical protein
MFFHVTGFEQSPPIGHGSQVQSDGFKEVSFRYMSFSLLQVSLVFQLRLIHDGEPSSAWFQPAGQFWHSVGV